MYYHFNTSQSCNSVFNMWKLQYEECKNNYFNYAVPCYVSLCLDFPLIFTNNFPRGDITTCNMKPRTWNIYHWCLEPSWWDDLMGLKATCLLWLITNIYYRTCSPAISRKIYLEELSLRSLYSWNVNAFSDCNWCDLLVHYPYRLNIPPPKKKATR